MTTQRQRPPIRTRKAPETLEPTLRLARAETERELSTLSDYLERAHDRVSRGEWSETWA